MKIKFVIMLLAFYTTIIAQQISPQIFGSIGIANNNSLTGVGAAIKIEYDLTSLPIAFRGGIFFSSAEFNPEQIYLATRSFIFKSLEADILYLPMSGMMQPYGGLGMGFTFTEFSSSGNTAYYGNNYIFKVDPSNSLNLSIIIGSKIAAEKTVSFSLEVQYSFIPLKYQVTLKDINDITKTFSERLSFTKVFLSLGLNIKI